MRSKLFKLLPAILLTVSLFLTYGFLTGFAPDDMDIPGSGPEENGDETTGKWVCPYCGYVYDPEIGDPENGIEAGTAFEDLPDEWVCPGCKTEKSDFFEDEEFGESLSSDPWIEHLQHVLEMRSKHIAVLERVIADHAAKDEGHSSISSPDKGLNNAILSSAKSIEKAKAAIDAYLVYLGSFKTGVDEEDDEGEDTEEVFLDSEDEDTGDPAETGKKDNNSGNNGKSDNKQNKDNKNNGKAKGKNK